MSAAIGLTGIPPTETPAGDDSGYPDDAEVRIEAEDNCRSLHGQDILEHFGWAAN
jgi:hypothetical protein